MLIAPLHPRAIAQVIQLRHGRAKGPILPTCPPILLQLSGGQPTSIKRRSPVSCGLLAGERLADQLQACMVPGSSDSCRQGLALAELRPLTWADGQWESVLYKNELV